MRFMPAANMTRRCGPARRRTTRQGFAIAARAALADAVLRDAPCLDCLQARRGFCAPRRGRRSAIWPTAMSGWRSALGYEGAHHRHGAGAAARHRRARPRRAGCGARRTIPPIPMRWRRWAAGISRSCAAAAPFWRACSMAPARSEALALFDRAVQAAPGNVAVRYQIALSLAGFDADNYRGRIESELAGGDPRHARHRLRKSHAGPRRRSAGIAPARRRR